MLIAVLGVLGVETTSFAALLAAAHQSHYWQVYFDANRMIGQIMVADQGIRRVS